MRHYTGKKYLAMIERGRGLDGLQEVLNQLNHPAEEDIVADGLYRRHFVRLLSPETNEILFHQFEILYLRKRNKIVTHLENVFIYDDEQEYEFHKGISSSEAKGTIQSN